MPARCSREESTISSFASRCATSSRCSQSHPPHRSLKGQTEGRRLVLGERTSTKRPRKTLLPAAISTLTRSPGRAPSTNRERPWYRPTPWPDLESRSIVTSARMALLKAKATLPVRLEARGLHIGKLFSKPLHEALDPRALFVVHVDELDPHPGNLVGRIVEFSDAGDPPVEIEGKRGVRKRDDQANGGADRERVAGVDEHPTAGDVHRPVGDEAIHAAIGDEQLVLQPIRAARFLGLLHLLGHFASVTDPTIAPVKPSSHGGRGRS